MIAKDPFAGFKKSCNLATIFIEWDQKMLLLCRSAHKPHGGKWCLPGGKALADETCPDAIIREVRQEVGIALDCYDFVHIGQYFYREPRHSTGVKETDYELHVYRSFMKTEPSITLDINENTSFAWVRPREALSYPLVPGLETCIAWNSIVLVQTSP